MKNNNFYVGEPIIYRNGDNYELGIIKRINDDNTAFVYYHTGDTAANTRFEDMHHIRNLYAFNIKRLSPEDYVINYREDN